MVILRQSVRGVSASALQRFAGRARRAAGLSGRMDVLITTDRDLRALNRRFRRKDRATDVLSFAGQNGAAGDIAISAETAARNARRLGHSTAAELKVLILHGALHLAGYDHERDRGQMARREQRLRRQFRLPTGLIERERKP
ncbi:MAG TPA: rRNA maturation RNase YbeY [Terriglobales bacterium]|nr:rRNA maturation RNase YbeY [Terriglobales bacterium]